MTAVVALLLLTSCGVESGKFRMQGRFSNLNQGEFYVYSTDGGIHGVDTIRVNSGRFTYEIRLDRPSTLIILFPNHSEQAVFAESGAEVTIKGDASHLKEMEITGTDINDQMTEWRMHANELTPPELKQWAIDFIRQHPTSVISSYLLNRYLVLAPEPDYAQAAAMAELMFKQQPDNGQLERLMKTLRSLGQVKVGVRLPDFSATDTEGRTVSRATLRGGLNVIVPWAMWNYDSQSQLRTLRRLQKTYGQRLGVLSISLDAWQKEGRKFMERDSITWSNVCDGRMWASPLVSRFGFTDLPANLLVDQSGKVVALNVETNKLEEEIKKCLK